MTESVSIPIILPFLEYHYPEKTLRRVWKSEACDQAIFLPKLELMPALNLWNIISIIKVQLFLMKLFLTVYGDNAFMYLYTVHIFYSVPALYQHNFFLFRFMYFWVFFFLSSVLSNGCSWLASFFQC